MISRHRGGETVRSGVYWCRSTGEFVSIPGEWGRLGGGPDDHYLRSPAPVVLIAGPLMGLAFAVFLPLSGLLVLIPFLAGKIRDALVSAKVSAAHMAALPPQPGISYLEPRPPADGGTQAPSPRGREDRRDGKLIHLVTEIDAKRRRDNG